MNIGFAMSPARGIKLAATTGNQTVALDGSLQLGAAGQTVQVYNAGTTVAFVAFGDSSVGAAVATGTPAANCFMVPPSGILSFTRGPSVSNMAYIMESSTASLYVNVGTGQ